MRLAALKSTSTQGSSPITQPSCPSGTRTELGLFPIGHLDDDVPGNHIPEMRNLAAVCPNHGLGMLEPMPPWFEGGTYHGHLTEEDQFRFR
jgi:hypothetical protein